VDKQDIPVLPLAISPSRSLSGPRCPVMAQQAESPPLSPTKPHPADSFPHQDPMAVYELDPTPWLPWGH
jgi:hypothetical protein